MDANQTRFFLIRTREEFAQSSEQLRWDAAQQALTLGQNQSLRLPTSDSATALVAWGASTPLAVDGYQQVGRLSDDRARVEFNSGRGFLPLQDGELSELLAPAGAFVDMALGGDGRLALPFSDNGTQHGLLLFHLARRWQTRCDLARDSDGNPLPAPRRAAVDSDHRVWLITARQLLLCEGEPLPLPQRPEPARFEPETANPRALGLRWTQALPAGWQALALCCDAHTLYVLAHDGAGLQAILTRPRSGKRDAEFSLFPCTGEVPFVIDLALISPNGPAQGRLAALAPKQAGDTSFIQRDATILELRQVGDTSSAVLVRERYPMLSLAVPRFVSSLDGQLRYQAEQDPDYPGFVPRPRELHALRRPQFHSEGRALLEQRIETDQPDGVWHRLYLDAAIPAGTSIEIGARVYDTEAERQAAPIVAQPAPLWNPLPSELPFASSLAVQRPGTSGLFEILLQRTEGPVRRLSGRGLQLQVTLRGDGHRSPTLHAIRVYCPRFSYQEAYLPELFRQELSFDPAQSTGPANGADVRERLLAAFEGVLTPLEGRIGASELLVHQDSTPAEHLPWLAEVLGTALPGHWPEVRQRRLIRESTLVQQYKGTLYAVNLSLDIASDGGVQRGEVVVVENFRLRRTMATILGVPMDDRMHPLTLGTGMSGNSIIGDSLILSESDARAFLALFSPALADKVEAAVVEAFFEQYAHQVTVLLHGRGAALRSTVEEVLAVQLPAHLQWRIFETEHPFVLGSAPLLAVDTFIEADPGFSRVTLNETRLGREGLLSNPAAFSPADINTLSSN
jgi:phage tail-like protein